MKKENFKNLLTDLYNIYNPGGIEYIEELVERYNRLEFDAIRNIFIKYNGRNSKHYNKDVGSDEYIINLIKEYEQGSRNLQNIDLKISSHTHDYKKEIKENVLSETNKTIDGLKKTFEEELNSYKQEIENYKKQLETIQQKTTEELKIIYRIFPVFNDSEITIPDKEYLSSLGRGARIIAFDKNNKIVGLEITDITIDYISNKDGIPIVEIIIDKS